MRYTLKEVKIPKTKRIKYKLNNLDKLISYPIVIRKKLDIVINNLCLYNKKVAHPYAYKSARKIYNKLLLLLTELLVTDDESGDTYMEALNQIERFRMQIKIKYRAFLEKKELESMSKQLKLLQMEAKSKAMEARNSYSFMNTTGKSR